VLPTAGNTRPTKKVIAAVRLEIASRPAIWACLVSKSSAPKNMAALPSEVKEQAITNKINVTALLRERELTALPHPRARPSAILGDELNAGGFEVALSQI